MPCFHHQEPPLVAMTCQWSAPSSPSDGASLVPRHRVCPASSRAPQLLSSAAGNASLPPLLLLRANLRSENLRQRRYRIVALSVSLVTGDQQTKRGGSVEGDQCIRVSDIEVNGPGFWPEAGYQRRAAAEERKPGSSEEAGVASKGMQGEALCVVNAKSRYPNWWR